jgi:hypothetical protein
MKKILGIVVLLVTVSSFGQGYAEGDNVLGLGIGLGNTYQVSGTSTRIPPMQLYYEAGITDQLGIGGFIGYTSTGRKEVFKDGFGNTHTYQYNYNYTLIGLRGAYHFGYLLGTVDNFDLYGGLSLGYAILNTKVTSSDGAPEIDDTIASGSGFHLGVYAGMRYYFDDSFGVFGEIGYNISVIQVGAVLKL